MTDITIVTEKDCLFTDPSISYNGAALDEDNLLMDIFVNSGLSCKRVAWEATDYDWSSTKIALIKTPWNYFRHIHAFREWIKFVAQKCHLVNDASIVLWNMDKHYLLDLKEKGIPIPETHILHRKQEFDPEYWNNILGNKGIVVKPFISGGAKDTFLLQKPWNDFEIKSIKDAIMSQEMMVQPFIPSIITCGETSLVFIDGGFTHAMIKTPKPNDFRVQIYHGGQLKVFHPDQSEVEFGQHVLQACSDIIGKRPVYARIDVCYGENGELLLMELEAIEPELWFSYSSKAVTILVESLQKMACNL